MMCVCRCVFLYLVARESRDHILEPLRWADQKKKNENMKGTNRMAGGACETKSLMSFKLCIVFSSSFFFLYVSIRCFVFPTMTWFCCFFFDLFANSGHIQERRSRRTDGRTGKYVSKQSKNKKQTKNTNWIFFYIYFVFYILWTKLLHSRLPCVEFWIYVILLCPWVPNARKIRNVLKSFF